jgi:FkbM family methyltransferase
MNPITSILRGAAGVARRNTILARLSLACIPDIHWKINVEGIGRMRVRLRRNRSFWLRSPLSLEWYPLAALRAFVRPGDCVWDVGANIGLYARWLVTHLNAKQVCSFEPMSENLPELRYNIELGGIEDRVTVVPWALSDFDGKVTFQIDDYQSASGSIDTVTAGQASKGRQVLGLPPKVETVASRTIDSILKAGELPRPDVMKVDIEGAELMMLKGGAFFFSEHSPRILIETHGLQVSKDCLRFLFEHGYSVAACVREEWHPKRHMRLVPADLERMADQYDAHFIMASKNAADLPDELDYTHL